MTKTTMVVIANLIQLMTLAGASVASLAVVAGLSPMTITKARMGVPVKRSTADLIYQTLEERTFTPGDRKSVV